MSAVWITIGDWVLQTACGGGLVLLIAWAALKLCRQPARRQRLGEWGVVSALLFGGLILGPRWLIVPLPSGFAAIVAPGPARGTGAPPARSTQYSVPSTQYQNPRVGAGPAGALPPPPPSTQYSVLSTRMPAWELAPRARCHRHHAVLSTQYSVLSTRMPRLAEAPTYRQLPPETTAVTCWLHPMGHSRKPTLKSPLRYRARSLRRQIPQRPVPRSQPSIRLHRACHGTRINSWQASG